jgi:uncharacterized protein
MSKNVEIKTEVLRTLHRIHRQISDLTGQIERGPRQLKAGEEMVAKAAQALDAAKAAVRKATMSADEKQLQLKSREMHIQQLEARLNTAATNREFTTFKEQIAADKQANSVLSDEILEALEHLDVLQSQVNSAQTELAKQVQEQAKRVTEINAKQITLKSELERVQGELAEAEKRVPAEAMPDYLRLTGARGEEALAPVDGNSCTGCCQTLTTQMVEELRMSRLVRCTTCDAFLYLPEDLRVK